ncbi:MAG: type II secretion system protein GspK, partial [Thioalkalispiraceae bacterium]
TGGYASVDEFLKHGIFNKEKPKKDGLAISSQHFLLSAQVIMGQSRSQLFSLVKRINNNNIVVLQRLQGEI